MYKLKFTKTLLFVFLGIVVISSSSSLLFAKSYPSKPISIIIPASPGGGGDSSLRILAVGMQKYLGVPVIIRNLPGGGGVTGFTKLWRSKPDGYTFGMWYLQYAVSRQLFTKVEFDVTKFEHAGQYVTAKAILCVPKDSQFKKVEDFAKAEKPVRFCTLHRTINFSLAAAALSKEMGFPFTFVTGYKGGAPSIIGAMKGEGDAIIFAAATRRFIESGDLIGLLAFSRDRLEHFPNIPILKDVGVTDDLTLISDLNYTMWAPPGTPADKVAIFEDAMIKATRDLDKRFKDGFWFPKPLPGKESKKIIDDTLKKFVQYKNLVQ